VRLLSVVVVARADETGVMAGREEFNDVVLPHLGAARRLARWLMRNEHDAEDVVQEASLRALRYFGTFTGGNGRAWFLRIVRNTCCGWRSPGTSKPMDPFDEEWHSSTHAAADPEALLLRSETAATVGHAMNRLPNRFRDLLILREIEDLSYREMADIKGIPIGTVMSGLSRARRALRVAVTNDPDQDGLDSLTRDRNRRVSGRDHGRRIALENDAHSAVEHGGRPRAIDRTRMPHRHRPQGIRAVSS
jgi:RNA polymerase sigma-70 factor (ECF subfamily)